MADVEHGDGRLPLRFWAKTVVQSNGCWLWTGSTIHNGYGAWIPPGRVGTRLVHRRAYLALVGQIPEGLDLDHLCRVRNCCNPLHLEPVTRRENARRGEAGKLAAARQRAKTHCKHDHELSGSNLYVCPRGKRECRTCRNRAVATFNQRNKIG